MAKNKEDEILDKQAIAEELARRIEVLERKVAQLESKK